MTVAEMTIEQRLERVERLIIETRLPGDQIVGAKYVAELFDCSEESVIRKRFGTDKIPRVREKPVGFRKADVHRVLREITKPAAEVAAEKLAKAKTRKRSIITKKTVEQR